jgi:P27 family predicted phage terminase small subunit
MARGRKVSPGPSAVADRDGEKGIAVPHGMTPKARAKWLAIVPLIAEMCPLRETDSDALRQYCEAVMLREKAMAELEQKELVLETPNGAFQTNPLLKIISQAEAVMMKLAERFGLDPASRRRLQIAGKKSASPFLDFLKKGRERSKPKLAVPPS